MSCSWASHSTPRSSSSFALGFASDLKPWVSEGSKSSRSKPLPRSTRYGSTSSRIAAAIFFSLGAMALLFVQAAAFGPTPWNVSSLSMSAVRSGTTASAPQRASSAAWLVRSTATT